MAATYSINAERVAWSGTAQDIVLLDLEESTYLAVNASAGLLWHALATQPSDVRRLTDELAAAFPDLGVEQAAHDVVEFLDVLVRKGFVLRDDSTDPLV